VNAFFYKSTTHINHSIKHQQPTYGNKADNVHLSAADAEKIDLSRFDESDPLQHMMKILFGCGIYCMFRGKEHASFAVSQIKFGHYPCTFEHAGLAGHPNVSIDNICDKSHRLTVHNSHARTTNEFLRFPINENDPACLGAAIKRFMPKLAPNQTRMYCRPATQEYIEATYRRHGNATSLFYANTPLGANKLRELMSKGAEILGISKNFRPHSLRAVGVTKLANDSAISDAERCRAARHASISANKAYQTVDGRSEANRLKALGVKLPGTEEGDKKMPAKPEEELREKEDDGKVEFVILGAGPSPTNSQDGEDTCSDISEPSLKIHKENTKEPSMTQVQIQELKSEFNSLKGMLTTKVVPVVEEVRKPEPVMSMTQVGIEDLKEKIGELQGLVKKKREEVAPEPAISMTQVGISTLREQIGELQGLVAVKKEENPPLSENQLAIQELTRTVKNLKDALEEKDLYCNSLEHDFFTQEEAKSKDFREACFEKRRLQRENEELLAYINRDKKRSSRRLYREF
jgi:hypothetical protein